MKYSKKFKTKLQKAHELLTSDKIQEALETYLELFKEQSDNVTVLIGMAQCYAELGEVDKALDILDVILSEFPQYEMAVLFKAQILGEDDRVNDAIIFLEGKIKGGFNDPEGYALLGELFQLDDKPILAITAYKSALGFYTLGDRRAINNNLAYCYFDISNYKKAIDIYDELLSVDPEDLVVLHNKALLLREINDSSESLKILKRVTELNPEFLDAWINLGDLYQELGDKDRAQECLDKAKEIFLNQSDK